VLRILKKKILLNSITEQDLPRSRSGIEVSYDADCCVINKIQYIAIEGVFDDEQKTGTASRCKERDRAGVLGSFIRREES
jgi:hypothetical protein